MQLQRLLGHRASALWLKSRRTSLDIDCRLNGCRNSGFVATLLSFFHLLDSDRLDAILKVVDSSPRIVLDVDLDFFSTKNPFLDLFPDAGLYSMLKSIYTFQSVPTNLSEAEKKKFAVESSRKRNSLLAKLQDLTNYMQENRSAVIMTGIC